MATETHEAPLIRYLLGQMGPEEQALVEERYLTDPDYHQELCAAERDLIDRYVRGELPDRDAFENQYLSSPGRRAKVEFARDLAQWSDRLPDLVADAGGRGRSGEPRSLFRMWQLAATVSIVLAGSLFVYRQRGPAPVSQSAPPSPQPLPPQSGSMGTVATFVLTPTQTRAGDVMPTLVMNAITDVRLQLELEPGGYVSYQAAVRTADGQDVWREDQLKPTPVPSGMALVVTLPATRFTDDDYTIRVGGVTGGGEIDELSGYSFRVRSSAK